MLSPAAEADVAVGNLRLVSEKVLHSDCALNCASIMSRASSIFDGSLGLFGMIISWLLVILVDVSVLTLAVCSFRIGLACR